MKLARAILSGSRSGSLEVRLDVRLDVEQDLGGRTQPLRLMAECGHCVHASDEVEDAFDGVRRVIRRDRPVFQTAGEPAEERHGNPRHALAARDPERGELADPAGVASEEIPRHSQAQRLEGLVRPARHRVRGLVADHVADRGDARPAVLRRRRAVHAGSPRRAGTRDRRPRSPADCASSCSPPLRSGRC